MPESEGLGEGCGHSRCYACCRLSQRAVCVAEWLPIISARWQKWRSAKVSAHSSPPSRRRLQGLAAVDDAEKFSASVSDSITPSPLQPRKDFGADALSELVESIRQHGIIQPLIVRAIDGRHELIAGERRWRAAQEAGLE